MSTYISILRGINVGGQKAIKMNALKEMYEDLHFINVQTYIQSGNVVFQYNKSEPKDLEQIIALQLEHIFGFKVPVIVLDKSDLKGIIERNPFKDDPDKNISNLHVTIFSSVPEKIDIEMINLKKSPEEEFQFSRRAVYLHCPNGYGKTKLSNSFFENKLNIIATTRNWKTTIELYNIAEKKHPNY